MWGHVVTCGEMWAMWSHVVTCELYGDILGNVVSYGAIWGHIGTYRAMWAKLGLVEPYGVMW